MKSFHSDPKIKEKYLARVKAHQLADHLIRGQGWNNGKGCAIGCTLEAYNHYLYEVELGIPEWLALVEDSLFEGMSLEKSKNWPALFLEAIPVGVNLEGVKGPFLVMVLESVLTCFDHEKFSDVKAALDGSIALWKRDDIGSEKWSAARAAAAAATDSSAAHAAHAATATDSHAVARAIYIATTYTGHYTDTQKFDYFADGLLNLLRGI